MKKIIVSLFLCFCLVSACGGDSPAPKEVTGPDLDIAELTSLRIDQLKITGGLENDKDGVPEFAVYLRCADSNNDIACAGPETGMNAVKKSGMLYGKIETTFLPIEGTNEESCFDVKLVFVEKDSANCPAPLTADDDVIWTSGRLSLSNSGSGNLLKSPIENEEKTVFAYLISQGDAPKDDLMLETAQQDENSLKLDQLFLTSPAMGEQEVNFRLWLNDLDDGKLSCEATFTSSSAGISKEGIIYGNLGIELLDPNKDKCLVTNDNKYIDVTVSLYNSASNETITSGDKTTLYDLVDGDGGKELFGEAGFVRFVPSKTPE